MTLWIVAIPPLAYLFALILALIWILRQWWRLWPTGETVKLLTFLSLVQCVAACLALWLTAQNPIGTYACMLGFGGMMANVTYTVTGVILWGGVRLFAPRRLKLFAGAALPAALCLMSCIAALVHTRSALLCTV